MNAAIVVKEILIMIILFSILTMGMLLINPLTFISDYPPEIQKEYYRSQNKEEKREKLTIIMKIKKIVAVILFTFVLSWMLHIAGCNTFIQGLGYGCLLILILFYWDTFVLDWILFPNIMRVRLPGTEHMDKEYHEKWFHVKVCLPMIPVFLIMGVISSLIMIWIW